MDEPERPSEPPDSAGVPETPKLESEVVDELFREHGEELRRLLFGVLQDWQLAQDAWQAAWTRMVEQGHRTREESRKAWLFRVGVNEAFALRRRAGTTRRVLGQLSQQAVAAAERSDIPVIRGETIEQVRQAIEGLPKEQQAVVRMRIYEQKKFVEIAEELEIPLGTALARMRSALAKLKATLGKDFESI